MRKEKEILSIRYSNIEKLNEREQANIKGGNPLAGGAFDGCPPPVGAVVTPDKG